jgi:hypothetical protein
MPTPAQRDLLSAGEAVRATTLARARNSLRYGVFGELDTTGETLQRIVEAVPSAVAAELPANAFVFVPLAIGETAHARDTEIARVHTAELADRAICHRTVPIEGSTYTFISTRLMQDRFALAFEVFINVGHQYVDALAARNAPIPERFTALLAAQAMGDVRGETSQDSYEARKRAFDPAHLSACASLRPPSPMRSPFTCSRSPSISTTPTCVNGSIRCWPRPRWQIACAPSPSSSPRLPATSSPSATAAATRAEAPLELKPH